MKPIIKVENLSKEYRIGGKSEPYSTFRESLVNAARTPLNALKRRSRDNADNRFWALKDINFTVEPGEVVGIIGRNGAGKSTLLKILSRITEPTSGRIELYGRVGSLLEVGTGFHPELTGRENVFLNGAILGMRQQEIANKFDEIVDFAEIEDFLDTPVKRYSSGMYTRLAFAVAANLDPEILIVDEVLSVGDSEFQKKCLGKMKDVSSSGRTVLFVSHNLSAVKYLCSQGLLLMKGNCVFFGQTKEALEKYQFNENEQSEYERTTEESEIVKIKNWYLLNQKDKHSCYTREEAIFNIEILVSIPLYNVEVGFIIRDERGEIIFSCNTRDFDGNFFNLQIGLYRFNLKIRLPLRAGFYNIDVAIASEGKIIDHWLSLKKLRILDDYTGVLGEKWLGIINEKFIFDYEKIS